MIINQEAIQKILGIKERVKITPEEMAGKLNVAFYPYKKENISKNVKEFAEDLEKSLREMKVSVIPYQKALASNYCFLIKRLIKKHLYLFFIFLKKLIFKTVEDPLGLNFKILLKFKIGKKIKHGIAIIAVGENEEGNLPMDNTYNFVSNPIITIVDMPKDIDEKTDFFTHFDTAINLFAHHMTNIIIAVDDKKWILYNFNASHPIYEKNKSNFKNDLLYSLIPKIAAPIKPPKFSEFILREENFDPFDEFHKNFTEDIKNSGSLFEKSGLYPPGKSIENLFFRNELYKWIGKLHLDGRNGMSLGFLAYQLPTKLPELILFIDAHKKYGDLMTIDKDYFIFNNEIFIIVDVLGDKYCLKVPEVWILTQRSGSQKTNIDPQKDILKMGLVNGEMFLETPKGSEFRKDFKPSFDTKVILAHAVGNAIVAGILEKISPNNKFSKALMKNGMALSHWHGYLKKDLIPKGWHVHGSSNPHVSCSTPQSAIYALDGKLEVFFKCLKNEKEYLGDVHIEPHHGTIINFNSLKELGIFLNNQPDIAKLGNCYLSDYK